MTIAEEDFWKDIFVHLQHKNMMRLGAERLSLSDCDSQFNRFSFVHPEINVQITDGQNFKTWEFFIRPNLKMRLYIQNQIKGSILEKQGTELVKVCDAKFVYNPFPEIEEFLSHLDNYLVEIERLNEADQKSKAAQRVSFQFVKAYLEFCFADKTYCWYLENEKNQFTLRVVKNTQLNGEGQLFPISIQNFKSEIDIIIQQLQSMN